MIDWPILIAEKVALKRRLRSAYPLISHYEPNPPASEQQILRAEQHLGVSLDASYREFLAHADGWRGFVYNSGLFGTDDLTGQTGLFSDAMQTLWAFNPDDDPPLAEGLRNADLLPIAHSTRDLDVAFIAKKSCARPGVVVRILGSSVTEFAGFYEFFCETMRRDRSLGNCAGQEG